MYRARLFGNHGFERDVAIKLLKEIEPDAEVLGRFRDEARLLGQIRHPNIPGVGPPVRLGPNWAVIMDLVEGRDCLRLLRDLERLPVRVVLEIGAEVSRTLHHLHEFKNTPEDTTLKLIHRDIKPSNIMVTPRGTISLLDFGIAKAEFANRETFTTNTVGGTIGYIPPERIQGIDGPAGDVYSLGVVMHALITGKKPSQFTEPDEPIPIPEDLPRTPAIEASIGLAAEMRRLNPSDRPTALEVARRCEDLARELEGPGLRDWAQLVVTRNTSLEPDDRVGSTLFDGDEEDEDDSLIIVLAPTPLRWIVPLAAVLIGVLVLGIWWSLRGGPDSPRSRPGDGSRANPRTTATEAGTTATEAGTTATEAGTTAGDTRTTAGDTRTTAGETRTPAAEAGTTAAEAGATEAGTTAAEAGARIDPRAGASATSRTTPAASGPERHRQPGT